MILADAGPTSPFFSLQTLSQLLMAEFGRWRDILCLWEATSNQFTPTCKPSHTEDKDKHPD